MDITSCCPRMSDVRHTGVRRTDVEKITASLRGNAVLDAPRPDGFPAAKWAQTTQSVEDGIPTRSVGTRFKAFVLFGLWLIQRYWGSSG